MKKPKGIRAMIVLCAVVLLAAALLLVSGVGFGGKTAAHRDCAAFFEAYARADAEAVGAQLAGGSGAIEFGSLTGAVALQTRVELGQIHETEDGAATISAQITTADLQKVFARIPVSVTDSAAAAQWLEEALSDPNVEKKTFDVEIAMVKEAQRWKITMTPELADALMGGYYSMLGGILQEGDE